MGQIFEEHSFINWNKNLKENYLKVPDEIEMNIGVNLSNLNIS